MSMMLRSERWSVVAAQTRCMCSSPSWRSDAARRRNDDEQDDSPRASTSASAHLFDQSRLEEDQERTKSTAPELDALKEKPWDGDEPQERAIRRILQDSYKPLRVKGFQKKVQEPSPLPESIFADSTSTVANDARAKTMAQEADRPKEPWEYTFKAPSWHTEARVRSEKMLQAPTREPRAPKPSVRLATALERAYDHRSGHSKMQVPNEDNPAGGMRNYLGFVEDKIQQARARGYFNNVKGRGKPIVRDPLEANPFIPRDEFLINRIVQGQGAAPPFVDLQRELDEAVTVFRTELRDRWTRRAIRIKSLGGVTRSEIESVRAGWRDQEWEDRERKFHELSVETANGIVRRYNGVAPFSARKGLLTLENEIQSAVRQCAPAIITELERRLAGGPSVSTHSTTKAIEREIKGKTAEEEDKAVKESMWRAFKRLVRQVVGQERAGEMRAQ